MARLPLTPVRVCHPTYVSDKRSAFRSESRSSCSPGAIGQCCPDEFHERQPCTNSSIIFISLEGRQTSRKGAGKIPLKAERSFIIPIDYRVKEYTLQLFKLRLPTLSLIEAFSISFTVSGTGVLKFNLLTQNCLRHRLTIFCFICDWCVHCTDSMIHLQNVQSRWYR